MIEEKFEKVPLRDQLLLVLLIGFIAASFNYLGYGLHDQISQLPLVMRAISLTYLTNDFFVNTASVSVVRFFYAYFVGLIAGNIGNLPVVIFVLTLTANLITSVITYFFSKNLFKGSSLKAVAAVALVMSVMTFHLAGRRAHLYTHTISPTLLVFPLILGSITLIVKKKPIYAMLVNGIVTLFHPAYGAEIGALLLLSYLITLIQTEGRFLEALQKNWKRILISGTIFLVFLFMVFLPQLLENKIDADQYIYILAYFRTEHHSIPSAYEPSEYLQGLAFIAAVVIIWYQRRNGWDKFGSTLIAVLSGLILFSCFGNYIFIEIFPTRIGALAHVFRLLEEIKWFGLVVVSGMILDKNTSLFIKLLYIVSVFSPTTLLAVSVFHLILNLFHKQVQRGSKQYVFILLSIMLLLLNLVLGFQKNIIQLCVCILLIVLFFAFRQKIWMRYATAISSITIFFVFGVAFHNFPFQLGFLEKFPEINAENGYTKGEALSLIGDNANDIMEYVRYNTPDDSVFLTPPNWGQFRFIADRAIVVDFTAIPYSDEAMLEWYQRMIACYGEPQQLGSAMKGELVANYRDNMNQETLSELDREYDFDYAVLYWKTETDYEVVYRNEQFKLVLID